MEKLIERTIDAYKLIIDFSKNIITLSSGILTALISFIIYQGFDLGIWNYISLAVIIISIIFCLVGFGKAIQTVKNGSSNSRAILHVNIGTYLMIIGVVSLLFTFENPRPDMDSILSKIESSTTSLPFKLTPSNLISMEYDEGNFHLEYDIKGEKKTILYSLSEKRIITIK